MTAMENLMNSLRDTPPGEIAGRVVEQRIDYLKGNTGLIPSDVLEFRLEGGAKVIVRPSGTEPKLKLYLSVREDSEQASLRALEELTAAGMSLSER